MANNLQQALFELDSPVEMTVRRVNVLRSPKNHGAAHLDSKKYLRELGIDIEENRQPIQFLRNNNELVHRWSPYVQGFSAKFVQRTLDRYRDVYACPLVLDPFAGSGTVIVQAKLNGYHAVGVELNPLLKFLAQTKVSSWNTDADKLLRIARCLPRIHKCEAPDFLKSEKQFNPRVLRHLEQIKSGIDSFEPSSLEEQHIKDLMTLAFASILIECSNLKRTPCLGYSPKKFVEDDAPFILFEKKVREIAEDLRILQKNYHHVLSVPAEIVLANSMTYRHRINYDLVVTSPPYMNGLDYVMNYKIEMGWLGFAENHKELKKIKDAMVVCDNVSKGLVRDFGLRRLRYTNDWIENIKMEIADSIARRGMYRRTDMPEIVHKYFDDMYQVMQKVTGALNSGGRFVLVVGDSLIADVYLPTDLILARIGRELGLRIERVEKARNRRSGQVRTYQLRETVVTLYKE